MEFTKVQSDIQSLIDEFVKFRILFCTLESKYRNMEENHRLDIVDINRNHADQIIRMEEETELLRSQLSELEQLHREEIFRIEKRNEIEKLNLQNTIKTLKSEINKLTSALEINTELIAATRRPFSHKFKIINPNQSTKLTTSIFKWPSLNMEISTLSTFDFKDTKNANKPKKRKLYTVNTDKVVDLPLL